MASQKKDSVCDQFFRVSLMFACKATKNESLSGKFFVVSLMFASKASKKTVFGYGQFFQVSLMFASKACINLIACLWPGLWG